MTPRILVECLSGKGGGLEQKVMSGEGGCVIVFLVWCVSSLFCVV